MSQISITNLKTISAIFEEIKSLEAQKTAIQELASGIATQHSTVQFSLHIVDENAVSYLNEEGSLRERMERMTGSNLGSIFEQYLNTKPKPAIKAQGIITDELSDTLSLEILGLIVADKNNKIKKLVDQLVAMGFKR